MFDGMVTALDNKVSRLRFIDVVRYAPINWKDPDCKVGDAPLDEMTRCRDNHPGEVS